MSATMKTGAVLAAALALLAAPAARAAGFGLTGLDMRLTDQSGAPAMQAGSHPFAQAVANAVITEEPRPGEPVPVEEAKDIDVSLPPGLLGSQTAVPRCAAVQFLTPAPVGTACPNATVVGYAEVTYGSSESGSELSTVVTEAFPVYNLIPSPGSPAKLGISPGVGTGRVPVTIKVGLASNPPYNLIARAAGVSQTLFYIASQITIWGTPSAHAHDPYRGSCLNSTVDEGELHSLGSCPVGDAPPLLTLPTSCAGPLPTTFAADSWQSPAFPYPFSETVFTHDDLTPPNPLGTSGCSKLAFDPAIAAQPTSKAASSPTGLDFSLDIDDPGLTNPTGFADSDIEKAVVTLPEGMTANPSLAEGLGVCTEEQVERETASSPPGAGCPDASKIGTVEVQTPLLEESLSGALYVAKPYENSFGSLLALYMTIKDSELGIKVTQALKVEPDPKTGQLITTAEELPQLPFSHFRLHFREGARSPLISPPRCGTYDGRNGDPEPVKATLYPYSGAQPVTTTSAFQIVSGPNESPCPGSSAPFHPGFEAGSINNQAGAYSPFYLHLTRKDGEQDMTKFSTVLPPGVVGKIAGLSWCPEAAIAQARGRTGLHGGQEELEHPSCPASSKIGRVLGGAGVGNQLTYVPGSLYLAGPYHGDPLSVVAIVPALAGPFDAGTVVVREALTLNPVTAEVEVDGSASDPIPHILKGIPLNVRDLRVYADKPEFTLNPTSCEKEQTRATLWGGGTVFAPSVETPVGLFARYQAANCAALGFSPKLAINLKGGTKRGKFPALKAIVIPKAGDANFKRAVVTLPHSAFLEQGHFGTICTRVQFAAAPGNGAACPAASIYGKATAWSPLLDEPLSGSVYLRSSSHNLPDLVVALHGLVDIDLASRIDSKKGGIRSTFEGIPDAPVSRFILEMQGGKKGLIVNSTNLCKAKHRANAKIGGQNGKQSNTKPVVRPQCGKAQRKRHRRHHRRAAR